MKKIVSLMLALLMCFVLVACGEKSTASYTVTLTNGTTREFSSEHSVIEGYEENEVVGEELYIGGKIEIIDEIVEIDTFTQSGMFGTEIQFADIQFGNVCHVSYNISNEDNKAIISTLKVGDTVKVTAEIEEIFVTLDCLGETIELYNVE